MYNPNENNNLHPDTNDEHTPKYAEGTQPIEEAADVVGNEAVEAEAVSTEMPTMQATQMPTQNFTNDGKYTDGFYHGVPSAANQNNYTEPATHAVPQYSPRPEAQQVSPPSQTVSGNVQGTDSAYYGTGYQASSNGTPTYTWNTQSAPQYTPHQPKQKKKKQSKHIGVRVLAVFMCCLIASAATLGAFTLMIKNGVVAIDGGNNNNAAFTIHQVIDEDNNNKAVGAAVGEMTAQEVAEKLIPSVVCIQTYSNTSSNIFDFFNGYDGGNDVEESFASPSSQGSGIIYTTDGYIVTNAHVVSGADKVKVVTSEGLTYEAEIIGADEMTDLAVIKIISEDEFTPAEFGSSDDLMVGDMVEAIGNPGGIELNSSVTIGYVSALNREITDSTTGYTLNCIQTDAAINPGNSGGALVNMYGQVVGINSSKIIATGYEGLGFAIPSDTAQPIVTNLMEYGYVKDRAMLGINPLYVDSTTARFYGLTTGMYVKGLITTEAQKSGLQEGDVITAIDGNPVTSTNTIKTYLMNKKPGETVDLTVNRATTGENLNISLVLSENSNG